MMIDDEVMAAAAEAKQKAEGGLLLGKPMDTSSPYHMIAFWYLSWDEMHKAYEELKIKYRTEHPLQEPKYSGKEFEKKFKRARYIPWFALSFLVAFLLLLLYAKMQ